MGSSWHTAAIYLWERNIMNRIAAVVAGLSLAFVGTSTTFATTINVPGDQPTIAAAISASSNGDVINIAAGTYNEYNLNPGGKAITIQGAVDSTDGSLKTTIDAQQQGIVFTINSGEGPETELRNLAITGGLASSGGGGIVISGSRPTFTNCTISNNKVNGGSPNGAVYNLAGGIYIESGAPRFFSCTITGNTVQAGSPNGAVRQNGAAMVVGGSAVMTNCTFSDNAFSIGNANGSLCGNGIIYCTSGVYDLELHACTFNDNTLPYCNPYQPPPVNSVLAGTMPYIGYGCDFQDYAPVLGMILSLSTPPSDAGACCYDGLCFSITEAECTEVGGTFTAEACSADTACATPCSSDVDNDGDVDIQDLLQMITDWGDCP